MSGRVPVPGSCLPAPEPASCDIWWARPSDLDPAALHLLDGPEQDRYSRYRVPADRDRFAAARVLLRTVAAGYLGVDPAAVAVSAACPDCAAPHGRPVLPGTGWQVSLSHSGDRVAAAFTRAGAVGVDVEWIDPARGQADLLPHVLAPAERERGAVATAEGFLRVWTRKEAVLKATGDGLRVRLQDVVVTAADEEPRLLAYRGAPCPAADFVLADLDAGPGYVASVSVISAGPVRFTSHAALPAGPVPAFGDCGRSPDQRFHSLDGLGAR